MVQPVERPAGYAPTDECTLLCLPYAGGDGTAYWQWDEAFPRSVRVRIVELPGRDGRRSGPDGITVADVAAQVAAHAHTPYALYGHSMGARLAFEVIRELRRDGVALPLRLYVGAAHPPHLREPIARLAHLSEDGFLEQLILRAGTPSVVRDDPDVREAVMPALRVDLAWLKGYRYRPANPLPVPVVAFAGVDDREVPDDLMLGWARHTSAPFRLHTLPGDHLFIRTAPQAVTGMIAADLAAARTGADPGPATVAPPAPDEVHLWLLALDRMPASAAATGELSTDDATRAAGIADETERRRHVACRVALRRLLRRYGTDVLHRDRAGPRWSVSRSAGTAVVAIGHRDLGVDLETLRPMADFDAFCERTLDPAERAEVLAEPEEHQLSAALRCWTAREAVRKAAAGGPPPTDPAWRITHLDLDGAVAAVATRGGRWRLRFETLTADLW